MKILEAYSVLVDAKKRTAYDQRFESGAARTYAGYESANAQQDQQEAADWFQRILKETPSEFVKTTLLVLIMCPVTLIFWLGVIVMVMAIYVAFMGQSPLGWGGVAILIFLLFANLLVSVIGVFMLKDLYYRVKRIMMWIAMRARIKRLFASIFGRKPGRGLRAR